LEGEVLTRDPADQFAGILPTAITDRVVGIVDDVHGGDPGQIPALRIFRAGQRRVRIADGEVIPASSDLMPSVADPGAAELNTGGTVFATSIEAAPGGTPQSVLCDIFADSVAGVSPAVNAAGMAIPDITVGALSFGAVPLTIQAVDGAGASVSGVFTLEIQLNTTAMLPSVPANKHLTAGAAGALVSLGVQARVLYTTDSAGLALVNAVEQGPPGDVIYALVSVMADSGSLRFIGTTNFATLQF